jgi:hypothetical protein
MKCQLCLKDKVLRKSHIIPEFFYKPLYDSLHRLQLLKFTPEEKKSYVQKGIREKLLCQDCEQLLSQFEDHARKLFYGGQEFSFRKEGDRVIRKDIDYKKFKLFELSLLWRAGVSAHPFFRRVTLGPHQERLRKMLISQNPGRSYEYGCVLLSLVIEGSKPMDEIIRPPDALRSHGHKCFRFLLGGYLWIFVVSKHSQSFPYRELFLSEDGKLTLHERPAENMGLIKGFAALLAKRRKGN